MQRQQPSAVMGEGQDQSEGVDHENWHQIIKNTQKYVVLYNDDVHRPWRKCLEGKHQPVCLHTMKQWPVTFSGHGASAYLVWVRRYCRQFKERSDKALQALFYFLICSFISKNPMSRDETT